MGIYRQGEGNRGSLKWIQILINRQPEILNLKIRQSFRIPRSIEIKWVSPLKEKGYADVNFVGDEEMDGPKSELEWIGVNNLIHSYLGIGKINLRPFMADIYIDVAELP